LVRVAKPIVAIIVVAVLIAASLSVGLYVLLTRQEEVGTSAITLGSDSDVATSQWLKGGDGTESNPYILSGLPVVVKQMGNSMTTWGLALSGINAHFVLRNVEIDIDPTLPSWHESTGIRIGYVTNGTIELCQFSNLTVGISVDHSCVEIKNNSFEECKIGIELDEPPHAYALDPTVVICDNEFSGTDWGIELRGQDMTWSHVDILRNLMASYRCGIWTYYKGAFDLTIAENRFWNGMGYAVDSYGLSYSSVVANRLVELPGDSGFYLGGATSVTVADNYVSVRGAAISIDHSEQINVTGNEITGHWSSTYPSAFGILVEDSKSVNLTRNKLTEMRVGIALISSGPGNMSVQVYRNAFVGNDVQAMDNSGPENNWDWNYWGESSAVPFVIDSDSIDHFPLDNAPT